jgi:hypothetical protein
MLQYTKQKRQPSTSICTSRLVLAASTCQQQQQQQQQHRRRRWFHLVTCNVTEQKRRSDYQIPEYMGQIGHTPCVLGSMLKTARHRNHLCMACRQMKTSNCPVGWPHLTDHLVNLPNLCIVTCSTGAAEDSQHGVSSWHFTSTSTSITMVM